MCRGRTFKSAAAVLLTCAAASAGGLATAQQNFPSKPVRLITSPAGGGADFLVRLLSPGLSQGLGQPAIVDNRPTNVGSEAAAVSPPDGYTVLMGAPGLW